MIVLDVFLLGSFSDDDGEDDVFKKWNFYFIFVSYNCVDLFSMFSG